MSPRRYEKFLPGVARLLDAYEYARDTDWELWDFAIGIAELRECGLTGSDLRWLVAKGFVEHAYEIPDDKKRSFRTSGNGNAFFSQETCFILTEDGVGFARDIAEDEESSPTAAVNGDHRECPVVPTWDAERHELRLGKTLVKRFKQPSPSQEAILQAFQEEGWPDRVDDPLPPDPEIEPQRRLSDVVKRLNRSQQNFLLRFMGDGTGEAVLWKLVQSER